MLGGIFSAVKNIIPKGTIFGDMLGSTREKGTGVMGINIGPKEFQGRTMPSPTEDLIKALKASQAPPQQKDQNVFITGLLIILGGFLLFTFIK